MDARRALFLHRDPYDLEGTSGLFLEALRQNASFQMEHCPEYASICRQAGFEPDRLRREEDLRLLPVLPTLYLKAHPLLSMAGSPFLLTATSSGTKGAKTEIGFDYRGLWYGLWMVLRLTAFHRLRSPQPANYIVLGYQPHKSNRTAIAKTAFGVTLFTPALRRVYALKYHEDGYRADLEGVQEALVRFSRSPFPTRIIGFPAYAWFLMQSMQRAGLRLRLHPGSRVLLGGGWKQFYREEVGKAPFYALMEETLGLPAERCTEFFGAVEHPILYCQCERHRFHLPIYSRVLIRDVKTLEPVGPGTPGLVNLLTPMVKSMPLLSVMTDDLGILRDGEECGCGIRTPTLEIIGRVGMQGIKTCAAGAGALLGGDRP